MKKTNAVSLRFASNSYYCLVAFAVLGCRPTTPLARVSGQVTYKGSPVQEGRVVFSNPQLGVYITANISGGSYEVITSKGHGLLPGEYAVAIVPPLVDHPVGPILQPPQRTDYTKIPRRYRDPRSSGFKVQLEEGNNRADFKMRSEASSANSFDPTVQRNYPTLIFITPGTGI